MRYLLLLIIALYGCASNTPNLRPVEGKKILKPSPIETEKVLLGVENFLTNHVNLVKAKRVGLVTNQSGVNRTLQSTADLLFEHPDVNLTSLYGPEHGIRGDIFAGHSITNQIDTKTGLPIYSLYGNTRKPTKEMLEEVDVIIFDIQDIGIRSYTYISTMGAVIEACAEHNKQVIIFDRPNPLGGSKVEGNIVHEGYFSFVGYYPIAYRHGMTIGEIAQMHNSENNLGADLTVIKLKNWKRSMMWNKTGLPWVPTSPHVPHWESSLLLAATGTFGELHVLSEGVGYTTPFEFVGAPWINANEFASALNNLNLPGIIFRPVSFKPYYFRLKDQQCQGVQLHIMDYKTFDSFTCGLHIMKTSMTLYPNQDLFAKKNRISSFNKVMGSDLITTGLQNGKSVDQLEKEWQQELNKFKQIRTKYLLY